jgi:hypothetical protein
MPTLKFVITAEGDAASKAIKSFAADVGASMEDVAKKAKASADEQKSSLTQLTEGYQSFRTFAMDAIGGVKKVWDFAKEGAENQRIAQSFADTTQSIGVNADEMSKALSEASHGIVDDELYIQVVTRNMALGVATDLKSNVDLMELARVATKRFGGDAGEAYQGISNAIANLQTRALKEYGIIVDATEANQKYAASHGLVADAMTEEQQRAALLAEVMEKAPKIMQDFGNEADTTSDKMKRAEVAIGNVIDVMKEFAATGVDAGITLVEVPQKLAAAFTASAATIRKDVMAGKMSVTDYNNAITGMANQMSGMLGPAVTDALIKQYALTDEMARAAQTYDSAEMYARRYAEAQAAEAATAAATLVALNEVSQGVRNQSDIYTVLDAAMDRSSAKMNLQKASAEIIANEMATLKAVMAGAIGKEMTQYGNKQDDLAEKAKKIKNELDKLGASQGRAVTTTKQQGLSANELTLAQLQLAKAQAELDVQNSKVILSSGETANVQARVAEARDKLDAINAKETRSTRELTAAQANLAAAQTELANQTDPMKQAELAVQVDKLREKVGGASNAVQGYVDNSKKIGELRGQYADINAEIQANAKEHEDATRRIVFSMLEQRASVDGLTSDELNLLTTVAEQWGLVDKGTAQTMQQFDSLMKDFDSKKKSISDVATEADNLAAKLLNIPSRIDVLIAITQEGNTAVGGRAGKVGGEVGDDGAPSKTKPTPAPKKSKTPYAGGGHEAFTTGADFIVPQGYGNDTFPMRVSSGERVIVQTSVQQAQAGGGGVVVSPGAIVINGAGHLSAQAIAQQVIQELGRITNGAINAGMGVMGQ